MKNLRCCWLTVLLVTSIPAITVLAVEPEPGSSGERVVYDASFFTPFSPRTALDMVKQTPGFVLAADEELRRGFAGAVGNVLVDGQRLAAKSQAISDVLQRIPSGEVLRIELLRGAAVAGDASGAPVLANVIRTSSTGGGAWALGFELANQDKPAPNGWLAWGGRSGLTDYSMGASSYALKRDLPGERSVYDGEGNLISRRLDKSPREFGEYALNGQAARPLAGGRMTFTGQVAYSRYADQSTVLTLSPIGAQLENEAVPYSESDRAGEAGANYQRVLGNWDLSVDALLTRKRHRSRVRATHFNAAGAQDFEFRQLLEQDSSESILRATMAREAGLGRIEGGAEIAVNTLDGTSQLTMDFGDGPVVLPVANANLLVKEQRAEVFIGQTLRLSHAWSLEGKLAAETSRLRFTGDTDQSVSLAYLKPRLQLTRTLGAHQLQLRLFRDVGQLDFTDFVSSAELSDDVINGGNPDLRPQTAWAAEMTGDFRLSATALRLRLFHHWLDDVNDLVPVGTADERVDAPGNIGRGSLAGLELALRVPLSHLLPGGSLTVSGTFQDAAIRDPLTGGRRGISELVERQLKAELRQDLQAEKFSWGVTFAGESSVNIWRHNEVDHRRKSSSLDLFAETLAFGRLKVRLTMVSALGNPETRRRHFFAPDRTGLPIRSEVGERHPGHWWLLTMSGGF